MYRLFFKLIWHLGLKGGEGLKIKPTDVNAFGDSARLEKFGLPPGTDTLRVWRSHNRYRVLPLPSWLKNEIYEYIKEKSIKDDEYVFRKNRTTVYQRLSAYGPTLGKKKKIGPDTLRKGFGIWYLAEGGHIEDLQAIFGHSDLKMTQQYLSIDGRRALSNFMNFQKTHSPYGVESPKMGEQFEKLKLKLCDILGGAKCVRCGAADLRILDFDHKEGGGKAEHDKFGTNTKMLQFYINNPDLARQRLQVLCANCNRIKKHENREFFRNW